MRKKDTQHTANLKNQHWNQIYTHTHTKRHFNSYVVAEKQTSKMTCIAFQRIDIQTHLPLVLRRTIHM